MEILRKGPPWVSVASLFVVVAACSSDGNGMGRACTVVGCGPALTLRTPLPAPVAELRAGSIEICRNGACISGTFTDPVADGGAPGVIFESPPGSEAYASGFVTGGVTRGLELEVQYSLSAGLADGDVYALTVRGGGGNAIVSVTRAVSYTLSYPNGKDCPPVCRTATVDVGREQDAGSDH